jgi:hypothetical protein
MFRDKYLLDKKENTDIDIWSLIKPTGKIKVWWSSLKMKARKSGQQPVLYLKQPHRPGLILTNKQILPDILSHVAEARFPSDKIFIYLSDEFYSTMEKFKNESERIHTRKSI